MNFSTSAVAIIITLAIVVAFYLGQRKSTYRENEFEKILAEKERLYRTLAENSPDLIVRYNKQGQRLYVNQTYERVSGIPLDDLLGKSISEHSVVKGDAAQLVMKNIISVFKTGSAINFEVMINLGGRDLYCDYHCVPEKDENNNVQSVLAVGRDITAYKDLELQLQNLATTDVLTGISNRRSFMERMSIELASVRRYEADACLLMIDIDHFKRINDQYGHAGGDAVLMFFTKLIQSNLRVTDIFGRIGGEEFGIILHLTPYQAVLDLAERLRQLVEISVVTFEDQEINFTISIGATNLDKHDKEINVALHRGDLALYQAKNKGRNRVVSSSTIAKSVK